MSMTTTKESTGVYRVGNYTVENWSNRDQRIWTICKDGEPIRPNGRTFMRDTKRQCLDWLKNHAEG